MMLPYDRVPCHACSTVLTVLNNVSKYIHRRQTGEKAKSRQSETVDEQEKKKIKTKRAPEIGAYFEELTRGSAPTRRARWPMLPPTTAFQVSATLRAAPPRPRPSCMCVRSMSVGCVSSVAHTAATVPDARLVIVFEVPRCIEDHVYQHSFLYLISRPLGRWQELADYKRGLLSCGRTCCKCSWRLV